MFDLGHDPGVDAAVEQVVDDPPHQAALLADDEPRAGEVRGVHGRLLVVVASYRQNVHAYPSGGGDYEVAGTNLGPKIGLVVASAVTDTLRRPQQVAETARAGLGDLLTAGGKVVDALGGLAFAAPLHTI